MAAKRNGLAPACLNFSKLVSAPKAVIAIVSIKVSRLLIPSTTGTGSQSNELNPITARKPNANQGMVIFHR